MSDKLVIVVEPIEVKSRKVASGDVVYRLVVTTEDKRLMALSQLDSDTLLKLTVEVANNGKQSSEPQW